MASVPVVDAAGKKVGSRELPADIFEAKISVPLMHQVVVAAGASLRAGTHATKTRGMVAGVTCGAGMPYKLSEIAARHNVHYLPIISSARALTAARIGARRPSSRSLESMRRERNPKTTRDP